MSTRCFICEESYTRNLNPPVTLTPCGHCACQPCIAMWRKNRNTCPECRQTIQKVVLNRSLMDLIEEQQRNAEAKASSTSSRPVAATSSSSMAHEDNSSVSGIISTSGGAASRPSSSLKKRENELLLDKCEYVVYIIDNSQSMEYYHDGKIFECEERSGIIHKQRGIMRWDEACSKIRQIAKYNLQRQICCSFFLLNPNTSGKKMSDWTENVDFVTFDPLHEDVRTLNQKYDILVSQLLSADNIRGSTPLDEITRYFGRNLSKFVCDERFVRKPICYNVITDGQPNSKNAFERELKYLAEHYNIFLTINLCTDDDDIVSYYNELDRKIGKELSGMDVIDDLEAEQREVIAAGNTFFVYSAALHVCRMAGCFSVVADCMDEERMLTHHANKLRNELCGVSQSQLQDENDGARNSNRDVRPNCYDRKNYVQYIGSLVDAKPKVYDFKSKQMKPIIDVMKLNTLLWMNEPSQDPLEKLQKWLAQLNQRGQLLYVGIGVFVVLVVLKLIFS